MQEARWASGLTVGDGAVVVGDDPSDIGPFREVDNAGHGGSADIPPSDGEDWIAVTDQPIPVDRLLAWVSRPDCGAVITFCGTVRDHSDGRPGVTSLEYEVYPEYAALRLEQVAAFAREQWPMLGRVSLVHRVGRLAVGDVSVVVAVSTPHRAEAFDAARHCIDTLKRTVPIWKHETWAGGSDWSTCAHDGGAQDHGTAHEPGAFGGGGR